MQAKLDICIEDAMIFTGGEQATSGNIGIRGNRIVSLGPARRPAKRVIKAQGLLVAPGFIDIHNHSDVQLQRLAGGPSCDYVFDPLIRSNHNYLMQGVTTVATGNCGEGITDFTDWERIYRASGFGTNVRHFIPYGSLRRKLTGAQTRSGVISEEEKKKLKKNISAEMEKGAAGMSTAFDTYPQCCTSVEEIIEMCKVIKKYDGVYVTHIRNESGSGIVAALQEAIRIAEESQIAVHLSQFRIYQPAQNSIVDNVIEVISRARQRGIKITASQNPYITIAAPCGEYLISHLLSNIGASSHQQLLSTANIHKKIETILEFFAPEHILIAHNPSRTEWEGATLAEIGKEINKGPADVLYGFYCSELKPYLVISVAREQDLRRLMTPEFVYTSSNGEVALPGKKELHPRSYGTFPRKISEYAVKEKTVSLAQAINSMTIKPASLLKLKKRGRIAIDYYADLVLFDAGLIADRLNYVEPDRYCSGIKYVIVNGCIAVENGSLVPENVNGKLLRN